MYRNQEGVMLVIVLLITAIAAMAFLFAASTMTITSRSSAASERGSAQALLAADSGLNTLRARAGQEPYEESYGSFEHWIEEEIGPLDLGDGISSDLDVVSESSDAITVQSTGTTGTSQRVLVQEFEIVVGPPFAASANVPAALTSVGTISSNSNALSVVGRDNSVADWTFDSVREINNSKTEYRPATLCDAAQGEYVELDDGNLYEVVSSSDCEGDMTLSLVGDDDSEVVVSGMEEPVTVRPTAITEDLTIEWDADAEVNVSEVAVTAGAQSLFGEGSPITIGDEGNNSSGTVTKVDGNVLTIEWDTPPTAGTGEGTVIRRSISSAVTGGDCDISKSTFTHGCEPDADLSNLFYKTFGIPSMNFLKDSLPSSHRLTGSEATDGRELSDITWVTDPPNNFKGQTGSGILVIETCDVEEDDTFECANNDTINLNVDNSFKGLIYVIGNADIQGNAQWPGAIVVDGEATVDTDVQGTADVAYDPRELIRALAGIEFPNPNPGGLGMPIEGTWRIR